MKIPPKMGSKKPTKNVCAGIILKAFKNISYLEVFSRINHKLAKTIPKDLFTLGSFRKFAI
jgi:hypothetical protein